MNSSLMMRLSSSEESSGLIGIGKGTGSSGFKTTTSSLSILKTFVGLCLNFALDLHFANVACLHFRLPKVAFLLLLRDFEVMFFAKP